MLPNFLGIGTQRAATTWLFNCLKDHPEVFMAEEKELSFFNIHYGMGLSYYSSFFLGASGYKAIGEITPAYLYCEYCPERMAKHLPKIKMIAILRNPVDRAFSDYQYFVKPKTGWSFEEALGREPRLLEKGLYSDQLKLFFSFFDREQFLILIYEDLMLDNLQSIKSIYKFITVDYDFYPSWIGKTVNTGSSSNLRVTFERLHLEWMIECIKKTHLDSIMRRLHKQRKQKAKANINPDTRRGIVEYFRRPNEKLEKLIGRDLSFWNK